MTIGDLTGKETLYCVKDKRDYYDRHPLQPFELKEKVVYALGRKDDGSIIIHFDENLKRGFITKDLDSRVIKLDSETIFINKEDALKSIRRNLVKMIEDKLRSVAKFREDNWKFLN